MAKVRITQVRSQIGQSERHRGTLRALGLGKIGRVAEPPAAAEPAAKPKRAAKPKAEEAPAPVEEAPVAEAPAVEAPAPEKKRRLSRKKKDA